MSKTTRLITIWIYALSVLLVASLYLIIWIQSWTGVLLMIVGLGILVILVALLAIRLVGVIQLRNFRLLTPFVVGLISLFIVTFQPVEWIIERTKSPIVLSGYCEHTVTTLSFIFRENKEFEYNAGAFLTRELYYGTYELVNDTIELNFRDSIPNNVNEQLILTDRAFIELGDTTQHRHFFQLGINEIKPVSNRR